MGDFEQTGPIAVYGATGYTGRLVAAELARRGVDCVLAGRSAAKLEIVAEDAGVAGRVEAVSLDDRASLRRVLEPCAAVIACAGPFQRHGEPVLRAAVETRTHYLDTTGEQPFMRLVFDRFGPAAAEAGVALVTAMGFDYVPGDMIAALTADGMGPLHEIALAYCVTGLRPSQGTARSGLGMIAEDDLEWRAGALRSASRRVGRGSFDFPAPLGRRRMVRYPAGEHLTVPRHVETANVRTALTADTLVPFRRFAPLATLAAPALDLAVRTPLRRLLETAIGRLPEGPSTTARRAARFTIVCDATGPGRRRRGLISGSDIYGLTARSTVEGAVRMAAPGFAASGALAPSQAFEPRGFLEALASFGVEFELGEQS